MIPKPAKYISDFEHMGFGMFIHYGLYSQIGRGEWIYSIEKLDMKEYSKLFNTFTAKDFDADDIVKTAKNAGCKYIVLTTRHHEGFSLYDTKGLSDYDSVHSPAKRDLVREFVDACHREGISPFLYHTTLDWYNEDYKNDFNKYLGYLRDSIKVLCTEYGKIGGFWFDGNWDKPDADWQDDELYGIIRKYQPDAMIINNSGLRARGKAAVKEIDAVTFEQGIPTMIDREGEEKYRAAEMCNTMNDHWGVCNDDIEYKSPRELINCLCQCRKVGANYLLNIGPTADGGIVTIQREYLKMIGKWIGVYGEALYNVKPYIYDNGGEDFVVKSDDGKSLYFYCIHPGAGGDENVTVNMGEYSITKFSGFKDEISKIYWLDNNEELRFKQNGSECEVEFTYFPYRYNYCIRVAKAELK